MAEPASEYERSVAAAAMDHADLVTSLAPAAERLRRRLAAGSPPDRSTVTGTVLVLEKPSTQREHLERVRRRRSATVETLRVDVDLQDALAMSRLLAVPEAIGIAFHLAADEGRGAPNPSAEGFAMLARRGVIAVALADRLARIVALRTRLAHGYATLDVDRLRTGVPAGAGALDRHTGAIARSGSPAGLPLNDRQAGRWKGWRIRPTTGTTSGRRTLAAGGRSRLTARWWGRTAHHGGGALGPVQDPGAGSCSSGLRRRACRGSS